MMKEWTRYSWAKLSITTNHVSLVALSFLFYNFQRSSYQILSAYIAAVICEIILFKLTKRYPKDKISNRVFSAITESAGLLLLIRSLDDNYYIWGSIIAVSSKYFLLDKQGRHIFNPTNLAIVATIAFSDFGTITMRPDEFNYHSFPVLHVLFFGVAAAVLAKVAIIPMTYLATFAVFGLVFSGVGNLGNFVDIVGPEIGATGLIFIFLMITDPATCPRTMWGRVIFAVAVASLTFLGRTYTLAFANYISLFAVYTLYGGVKFVRDLKVIEKSPVLAPK